MSALNTFFNWRTSRNTAAIREQGRPQLTPERAAEVKHESRFALMWVWFGIISLPALFIGGAGWLWLVIPLGLVFGLIHMVGASAEAGMSDEQLQRESIRRQVKAGVRMGPAGCTWCGSAAQHKNDKRRPQHPLEFHATDIEAEVQRRMAL